MRRVEHLSWTISINNSETVCDVCISVYYCSTFLDRLYRYSSFTERTFQWLIAVNSNSAINMTWTRLQVIMAWGIRWHGDEIMDRCFGCHNDKKGANWRCQKIPSVLHTLPTTTSRVFLFISITDMAFTRLVAVSDIKFVSFRVQCLRHCYFPFWFSTYSITPLVFSQLSILTYVLCIDIICVLLDKFDVWCVYYL